MKGRKYTLSGVSVLVIQETAELSSEDEMRALIAQRLADPSFGVGADIVAFFCRIDLSKPSSLNNYMMPTTADQLATVLREKDMSEAFLIRAFLPSGQELPSSAMAMGAVADYIYEIEHRKEVWFVGEFPLSTMTLYYVYRDLHASLYNIAIGQPNSLPKVYTSPLYRDVATTIAASPIEMIRTTITLESGTWPFIFYAVYTGDPHLVCFVGKLTPADSQNDLLADIFEQPVAAQSVLLEQVVAHINGSPGMLAIPSCSGVLESTPPTIFNPDEGINIVFARVNEDTTLDARFYRRGTCKEVRLSGTGAVAAVIVGHQQRLLPRPRAEVRGLLNVSEGRHEAVVVQRSNDVWWLETSVERIWSGQFS